MKKAILRTSFWSVRRTCIISSLMPTLDLPPQRTGTGNYAEFFRGNAEQDFGRITTLETRETLRAPFKKLRPEKN